MTRWALPVVLVGCAIGGLVGWSSTVPVYRSEAFLDCSLKPRVIFTTNHVPADNPFVDSVASIVGDPRPNDHPALEALGMSRAELLAGLTVTRVKKTAGISVAFEHTDRRIPAPVVNAVIAVYRDRKSEASNARAQLKAIETQIETQIETRVAALRDGSQDAGATEQLTPEQLALLREREQRDVFYWEGGPPLEESRQEQVRVATYAEAPSAPARDQRPLFASIGALLAGVLAAFAGVLQQHLGRLTDRSEEDES